MKLMAAVIIAISLTACGVGGKKEEDKKKFSAKVKPESTAISGDLSDYLQVVDNEYEVTHEIMYNFSIKIKAIKAIGKNFKNKDVHITASLLSDNGMPVSDMREFTDYASKDKIMSLLNKGSGEEIIQFTAMPSGSQEIDASKLKKFSLSSVMKEREAESSSSNDGGSSVSGLGSEDYDKVLDNYEDYVDQYIKFLKKANNGDMSAMSEYPGLMEKAKELGDGLEKGKGNNSLSAKQIGRMAKIQTKMMQAALDMQKK